MTVKGRVVSLSHLGGLLAEFKDRAPGLGWEVRIEGGRAIGRVDSVIGGVSNALIHVTLSEKINPSSAIGAPLEIARRSRNGNKKRRNASKSGGPRKDRSKAKNMRNEKSRDRQRHKRNDGNLLPTWVCSKCRSMNSRTSKCSKCGSSRPTNSSGTGRSTRNRSRSGPVQRSDRISMARNRNDRSGKEGYGKRRGRSNRRSR